MAIQNINIGTSANDGTGNSLKNSFIKTEANFNELYNTNNGPLPPAVSYQSAVDFTPFSPLQNSSTTAALTVLQNNPGINYPEVSVTSNCKFYCPFNSGTYKILLNIETLTVGAYVYLYKNKPVGESATLELETIANLIQVTALPASTTSYTKNVINYNPLGSNTLIKGDYLIIAISSFGSDYMDKVRVTAKFIAP